MERRRVFGPAPPEFPKNECFVFQSPFKKRQHGELKCLQPVHNQDLVARHHTLHMSVCKPGNAQESSAPTGLSHFFEASRAASETCRSMDDLAGTRRRQGEGFVL